MTTPQTTRCQCGHEYADHKSMHGVPIGCCHEVEPDTVCSCESFSPSSPVPAPSAPARAGEPTLERKEQVAILVEAMKRGDRGQHSFEWTARLCLDELEKRSRARALAPATAEPTAEATEEDAAWVEQEGRNWHARYMRVGMDEEAKNARDRGERIAACIRAALRGSGPVGQASEPVAWTLRYRPTDKICAWVTAETQARIDVIRDAHNEDCEDAPYESVPLYAGAVAASAEAKRVEITDAMARAAYWNHDAAFNGFGVGPEPTEDVLRKWSSILRAALSPESGV